VSSRQATSEYARIAGPAISRVGAAVRSGRLVRQPCVECGETKVQAHHHHGYDADHALDVVWLCRVHHLARHGRVAKRWTWERGYRNYTERTRGARYWLLKTYSFSEGSGPKRLLQIIELAWSLLRTEEERRAASELFSRLTKSES